MNDIKAYPVPCNAINVSYIYCDKCILPLPLIIGKLEVEVYKRSFKEDIYYLSIKLIKLMIKITIVFLILLFYDIFLNILIVLLIPKSLIYDYSNQFCLILIVNLTILGICLWIIVE